MASKQLQYHFKKGKKEIYLPNFVLTFVQSPFLPATYAKFIVPLNLTKLDLRDYLFHAYNIRVLRVRSFVEQQKVTVNARNQKSRKRAIKKMTVEMDKPFVWPEMPESLSEWDKETFDAAQEQQERHAFQQSSTPVEKARRKPKDKASIAAQAQALLTGKDKWRPTWEALGKQVAYEQKDWSNREVRNGEEPDR